MPKTPPRPNAESYKDRVIAMLDESDDGYHCCKNKWNRAIAHIAEADAEIVHLREVVETHKTLTDKANRKSQKRLRNMLKQRQRADEADAHIATLESKLAWTEEFNRRLSHLLGEDEDKIEGLEDELAGFHHQVIMRNIDPIHCRGGWYTLSPHRAASADRLVALNRWEQHPDEPELYREKGKSDE